MREEPDNVRDEQPDTSLVARLNHGSSIVQFERHRFLADDMFASICRLECHRVMQVRWHAQIHDIDMFKQFGQA